MANIQTNEQSAMLMESGSLAPEHSHDADSGTCARCGVEVHRGMVVQTSEWHTVGRVAAVVLEQEKQVITHILMMRERQLLEYRLVPVELIEEVNEGAVLLRIFQSVVESLPVWHSV